MPLLASPPVGTVAEFTLSIKRTPWCTRCVTSAASPPPATGTTCSLLSHLVGSGLFPYWSLKHCEQMLHTASVPVGVCICTLLWGHTFLGTCLAPGTAELPALLHQPKQGSCSGSLPCLFLPVFILVIVGARLSCRGFQRMFLNSHILFFFQNCFSCIEKLSRKHQKCPCLPPLN